MAEQQLLPTLGWPALVPKPGPALLSFAWDGKPPHKARHRSRVVIPKGAWSFSNGLKYLTALAVKQIWIQHYSDNETEQHERAIAEYVALLMRRVRNEPTERPLCLVVHAFRIVPESWSPTDKAKALAGNIVPTSRPDGDNYLKLVQDALNGVAYKDDSQIVDSRVIKRYSDRPALQVELREMVEP